MTGLVIAIEKTLSERVNTLADRIVRLDVPHSWPVSAALTSLSESRKIRVLVSRPFLVKDFNGLETTVDAGVATQWRNETGAVADTIIIGSPRGRLVDGLRDVTVINGNSIVKVWSESELERIRQSGYEDLCKPESTNLIEELFSAVSAGVVDANQMVKYLDTLHRDPSVESITKNLWLIGLMEDAKALDTRVSSERVRRNQALVDDLANSDDPRIDSRLKRIIESARSPEAHIELAKKLKSYREDKDKAHLRGVQLNDVELLLNETAPSPGAKGISFSHLLDKFSEHPLDVTNALKLLRSEWEKSLDSNGNLEITFPLDGVTSKCSVKLDFLSLEVSSVDDDEFTLARPWTRFNMDGKACQILTAQSDQASPIQANQLDGNKAISSEFVLQRLKDGTQVKNKFIAYLSVREKLSVFEPFLERVDLALAYLILFPDSLSLLRQFLSAWDNLMSCIVSLESDEHLVYVAQVLETIQHQSEESPEWIVLGTLHPFRVGPMVEVAEFITSRLQNLVNGEIDVSNLGKAMEWLIDRSYPSYPTMHCKSSTLSLASTGGINVVYEAKPKRHLPAARDSVGLDQLFRSFIGFSNWYRSGMSVLVIDCPSGGGVAKSLTKLANTYLVNGGLSVYELGTSEQADSLASVFDGPVRSLRKSPTLADACPLPQVNVTIRFVHEAQATSESASLEWAPTKGSYLTFELVDTHDDIFSDVSTSKIKIDPTTRNFAVLRTHELYKKYRGGTRPEVATIRPLLETDERPVLSSLATNTDWLIFAAPGPLGLVAPTTINKTLRYVGKASMGQYGLYAYAADDLFSVRKKFESYISDTPVSTVPPKRMVDILTHKAKESGNAVLMSATAGVQAELAALVALYIAREGAKEGDFDFVLSLDDFGWTGAWLRDGIRADYLIVRVAASGAVHLCVLESKSERPGPRIACEQNHKAFSEGISQVQKTLDVLAEIFFAEEPTLDQDLRFSTLIEQLMAVALAEHIEDRTSRLKLFKVINDLSARRLRPTLDGLVVLTQAGVTESRLEKSITKTIRIVAAGRSEVERTFGVGDPYETTSTANQNVKSDSPPSDQVSTKRETKKSKRATEPQAVSDFDEVPSTPVQPTRNETTPKVALVRVQDNFPSNDKVSHERPSTPDEYVQLARRLISVAALQKVEVDGAEPVFTLDGPSLITIGVRLKEGASLQPFRARLGDIARDIGMGDKADFIQVENDSMPRTVRVIIPRPEKNIPPVPQERMDPLSDNGYLPIYMGQTVDGRDYKATVESWPHMLVAGSTGTGKTTLLKTLLTQLGRYAGDHLQFLIADGKGETDYMNLIPEHGFVPEFPDVQLGAESALQVLQWAVEEMERRREHIVNLARKLSTTQQGVSAISLFKEAVSKGAEPPIRPLIIVVDEFADIIISSKKNADTFENLIQRISQVGRSRMMHLLLATQRPDKETIRGAIKANLNARVVLQLPTQADSMTVLGQSGAEKLLKPGDFLFQRGSGSLIRLQGYCF